MQLWQRYMQSNILLQRRLPRVQLETAVTIRTANHQRSRHTYHRVPFDTRQQDEGYLQKKKHRRGARLVTAVTSHVIPQCTTVPNQMFTQVRQMTKTFVCCWVSLGTAGSSFALRRSP
jgi:hypothetical protein